MSLLVLRWRKVPPAMVTRWRGPSGRAQLLPEVAAPVPLAAIIGPPGPPGAGGDLANAVIDGGTFN